MVVQYTAPIDTIKKRGGKELVSVWVGDKDGQREYTFFDDAGTWRTSDRVVITFSKEGE